MKKCFRLGLKTIFSLFLFLKAPIFTFAVTDSPKEDVNLIESQSSLTQIIGAAENGDPDAQYALGYMYYYGRGVSQDMKLAKRWIKKAAEQGQQQAIQAEKILLGTAPTIQPKVNPILQPTEGTPDRRHAPVEKLSTIREEPVEQAKRLEVMEANKVVVPETTPVVTEPTASKVVEEKSIIEPTPTPTPKPVELKEKPLKKSTPIKIHPEKSTQVNNLKKVIGNYYTIQLLSSSSKQEVIRYVQKLQLKQASYYETYRNNQNWYVVTYGKFPSRKLAAAAIRNLPPAVQNNGPWVKSSQAVHNEMKKSRQ